MKPKVYLDVNFLVHAIQGSVVKARTTVTEDKEELFQLQVEKAYLNLVRGYAGSHVSVCVAHFQLSVLKKALVKLELGHVYSTFTRSYIEFVKKTKGDADLVQITPEDYDALENEAATTGAAPDGEDLGQLKAMLRLGVTTFITDDTDFAPLAQKAGLEVIKTNEFVKLANRGQFFPRQLAKAC